MARCPAALWHPLGKDQAHQPLMSKYDLVIIHTMVGSLEGTDSMFKEGGYSGTESHFGTGYIDGKMTAYQWVDTARTADANLDANPRAISIENEDTGPEFPEWNHDDATQVPAFTDAQCEKIAQLTAWACKTHNVPAEPAPDSLYYRRGIAYHRQGIDPWRVSGGQKWSTSTGKRCPGDKRAEQVKNVIIPRVKEILAGKGGDQGGDQGSGDQRDDGVKHENVEDAQKDVAAARNSCIKALHDNPGNEELKALLQPLVDDVFPKAFKVLYNAAR